MISRIEIAVVCRLVGWRVALPVLRRVMPLERLIRLTGVTGRVRTPRPEYGRAVLRVASRLWLDSDTPCLERSLAVHRQLGLEGCVPVLVLGLAEDHSGHAWVELDGDALLEATPPQNRYSELMRFDVAGNLISSRG